MSYKAARFSGGRRWGATKDEDEIRPDWARWPDANVVITSGYDLREAQQRFAVRPAAFLQKPYTAAQLTSKVAELVRSRA